MISDSRQICSVTDLIEFVGQLVADIESGRTPLTNSTVASYLEAFAGSLEDFEGRCHNRGEDPASINPYKQIADALDAATIYD